MTQPPDEPAPELERVVDAITDGADVEWDAALADPAADSETLEALRLIDDVARVHRGGAGPAPDSGTPERVWGNLLVRDLLGVGVYGEVYRAFDPGLRREVALKLWSPTVRPRLVEQLLAEARALARVRHPNVLMVHGADVHDGRAGMWTELLEGQTLEHMVTHYGPCNWREAALYGMEMCRALAAVHALGLVHRDVKASNFMREHGGRIVLMDFGSATDRHEPSDATPASLQGTPLAMAPEVLNGAPATVASDLYSLGVLLFRQLTGHYPVEATTREELVAAFDRGPLPLLRTLRPEVPLEFAGVLDRVLDRDPAVRPASAAELERQLAEALSADWPLASRPAPPRPKHGRAWIGYALAAVLAGVFAGAWWANRIQTTGPARAMQFTLQLPLGEHVSQFANVVVSPDGGSIAFASTDSTGKTALWIRRFDSRSGTRIPGTEGANYPFWSPDSRNVAFFSHNQLERVAVDRGNVRVVCKAELGRGGTWGRRGVIVFASSSQGPLARVPAEGGPPMPASTLDAAEGEVSHRWPCFLPDGEHFLYVAMPDRKGAFGLFVGSLHSDRRAYIGPVESGVAFSSGMLVYVANRTLEARPFDPRTLRWAGDPQPVSDLPGLGGSVAEPHASLSDNGTLVSTSLTTRVNRLAWLDARSGELTGLATGAYFHPHLSPDGRRAAAERVEGTGRSNIWLIDARTGAAERWTDDGGLNRTPSWSPAGDSIVFSSNRSGHYELFARATSGSLAERRLLDSPHALLLWANDWRAGGLITYDQYEPGLGYNVYELRGRMVVPIANTPAAEMRGALSPDARWLAYDSDATGHSQVYVMNRVTGERFVLPGEPAQEPRWARGSGRLYFHTPAGVFQEVTPLPGKNPTDWPVRRLFGAGVLEGYDVDPAGTRLLCCVATESGRPEEIIVLANLRQALEKGL